MRPTASRPDGTGRKAGSSRRKILAAAAELFAEHGYHQVTIRDIAIRTGLSPAMVMKCGGSKRELFLEAATVTPPSLPDVPLAQLGETLVGGLFERFERGAIESLNRAVVLRLSAPDPESVRERFITGYLDPLAERLGDGQDARLRAELIISTLVGLAVSLRIFETPVSQTMRDEVTHRYGRAVQQLIDA